MGQVLLLLVVALTVAAVVFGVTVLVTGADPGLVDTEPDGRAVPLPGNRPLQESDVGGVRFDTTVRGYRMAQVDQALRRTAYDIGYKDELIGVLQAEVDALRAGRVSEAEELRRAREAALAPVGVTAGVGLVDLGPSGPSVGGGGPDRAPAGPLDGSAAGSGQPEDDIGQPDVSRSGPGTTPTGSGGAGRGGSDDAQPAAPTQTMRPEPPTGSDRTTGSDAAAGPDGTTGSDRTTGSAGAGSGKGPERPERT